MTFVRFPLLRLIALLGTVPAGYIHASESLPAVPAELKVELFAREPAIRNPAAMAFDRQGRLFVGQGPQYRNPKPDTPGDTIVILLDTNGDGVADTAKTFAEGFNSIQGLAWHGRDLWVGNSPDLTIVRDLDGDDVADEYVRVYTDLGNLEHANHGHTWAPDGKLYFTHGTSKGLTLPGRVAPLPFRELWDVKAPPGTPDFPPPQVYRRGEYKRLYQDPDDDWGREGGMLRSDDLGANLEIVARGMRNPWDVAFDSGFNWLGTDNDQSEGDRIMMPFFNAHFGWGHSWSTHWTGREHLPTAPVSGPVFDGSGTGIVFYDFPQLPATYRGVWFFNDWLRKTTFAYRPRWDGALLLPEGGRWQPFASGGGAERAAATYGGNRSAAAAGALYKPVDIVIGPEGALYVSGWGDQLGVVWGADGQQANEGRVFRISWPDAPKSEWNSRKRTQPLAQWTFDELVEDLGSPLPVWNIDAQDELVRRGPTVIAPLKARLARSDLTQAQETWTIWTLGRIAPQDLRIEEWLGSTGQKRSLNARIQAIRIAGHRIREHRRSDVLPSFAVAALDDPEPRVRFAAVQSASQARQKQLLPRLTARVADESDRLTFYATWQALRALAEPEALRRLLADSRPGVRRAALLALAEGRNLDRAIVQPMVQDRDGVVSNLAATWLAQQDGNPLIDVYPRPGIFVDKVRISATPGIKPAEIRYTTDGSEPTLKSPRGHPGTLTETTTVKAALFMNDRQVGNTFVGTYTIRKGAVALPVLGGVNEPTTVEKVLPLLAQADARKGRGLFTAAGCMACHRVGDEGTSIGPDLSTLGDRDDADSIIRSILSPNSIIVEGYSLLTIGTRDGNAYAGIFEQENDRVVRLVQINGESVSIDKSTIVSRQSVHQSPMPPYERVFSPSQLADLTAWLMQQRTSAAPVTSVTHVAPGQRSSATAQGLSWVMEADRLTIRREGKPVADYVFSDPKILRPYFQNVRAPSGVQITRNNPLLEGDATDHATMHPGIWLGFGDISGQDFWRNKGRIEHVRFVQPPEIRAGVLTFATANRLLAQDGSSLGRQESRFSLRLSGDSAYLLTWETELLGEGRGLVFGDQEEMGLGVRVATPLTEKAGGLVVNSEGARGARAAWGKPAAWASYSRERDSRIQGAAIFPSQANPTPTWWHSRDYGVIVANGFGERVLPPAAGGKLVIQPGESLRLRYGILLFDTPASAPPDFDAVNREFQTTNSSRR